MQYVSKNPLIIELKNIAKYNKTENAINAKKLKETGTTNVNIFTDKEIIKLFLEDIQTIINESNYNTKRSILLDLKDILINLKILSTTQNNANLNNILNNLNKANSSLTTTFKANNINTNNINSIIQNILNQPLDTKYISEIFKTINTSTIYSSKSELKTVINNLSGYNTYIEKEYETTNKLSKSINTLNSLKTKFKIFNTKVLNVFSLTFNTIGKSITFLSNKTSNFIKKTLGSSVNLIKTIFTTSIGLVSNIIKLTPELVKAVFNSFNTFLFSPAGLSILAFIGGYLYGKFSKQIHQFIDNIKETIFNFTDIIKTKFSLENIEESIQTSDILTKIIDKIQPLIHAFDKTKTFINANKDTIISIIKLLTTSATTILAITKALSLGRVAVNITKLMRAGLAKSPKGAVGGISGALSIFGASSAIQTIYSANKETTAFARKMLNINSNTINAFQVTKTLMNLASSENLLKDKKTNETNKKVNYDKTIESTEYANIQQSISHLQKNYSEDFKALGLDSLQSLNFNPTTEEHRDKNRVILHDLMSKSSTFTQEQYEITRGLMDAVHGLDMHYEEVKPFSTIANSTATDIPVLPSVPKANNQSNLQSIPAKSILPNVTPYTTQHNSSGLSNNEQILPASSTAANIPTKLNLTDKTDEQKTYVVDNDNSLQANNLSTNADSGTVQQKNETKSILTLTNDNNSGFLNYDVTAISNKHIMQSSLSDEDKDMYNKMLEDLIDTQNKEIIKIAIQLLVAENYKQFKEHYNTNIKHTTQPIKLQQQENVPTDIPNLTPVAEV